MTLRHNKKKIAEQLAKRLEETRALQPRLKREFEEKQAARLKHPNQQDKPRNGHQRKRRPTA